LLNFAKNYFSSKKDIRTYTYGHLEDFCDWIEKLENFKVLS